MQELGYFIRLYYKKGVHRACKVFSNSSKLVVRDMDPQIVSRVATLVP